MNKLVFLTDYSNDFFLLIHLRPIFCFPYQSNKENEAVNLLTENSSNHQTDLKSDQDSETLKTSSGTEQQTPSTDQKCGKPERGVKRSIKNKQPENSSNAGHKVADSKQGTEADQPPEPIAKRTVRLSKTKKEPAVASSSILECQPEAVQNSKSQTHPSQESDALSNTESKSKHQIQEEIHLEEKSQPAEKKQVSFGLIEELLVWF